MGLIPILSFANSNFKVVIDPGHGGADFGTVHLEGKYPIAEKHLTLGLALELELELERAGISTTLTRRSDIDLPLPARTQIANQQKADLFISIHLNSTKDAHEDLSASGAGDSTHAGARSTAQASGIETYILNHTSDASSKRLAHLENKGLLIPDTSLPTQDGDIALILKDLQLDSQLIKSRRIACYIQNALTTGLPEHQNRGVKEGLFYVLLGANMPAALIEVGFLSNPKERAYMLSYRGRLATAQKIAKAIQQYRLRTRVSKATVQETCKLSSL